MKKIVKNWNKFNENLILERSSLSEFFNREEVMDLHKNNKIPHDAEISEVSFEEIESLDQIDKDRRDYVIYRNIDGNLKHSIIQGLLYNVEYEGLRKPTELYLLKVGKSMNYTKSYDKMFDKGIDRNKNKGYRMLQDYFYKYCDTFIDKLMDKLNVSLLDLHEDEIHDIVDELEMEFQGFEYIHELIQFVVGDTPDNIDELLEELFQNFCDEDEVDERNYNKSYDEFKHDFSKYILTKNKKKEQ
tara:strand:+ start:5280 stop:6011 length:732 start_codon:yes stop_codon:yes gene_type:complete